MGQKILTLLTDFGSQDSYVGVMKGVIYTLANRAEAKGLTVVDLTHAIPPQDIAAARFNLLQSWAYFPVGTVHVAVVDPGVGGKRRAIALRFAGGFLVGPDNGLFSGVLEQSPVLAAVELTNSQYWHNPKPSSTFHGRDIFAAVGAHLAMGVPLERLGRSISPQTLVQLPIPLCEIVAGGALKGTIQYVDQFGNLITNIPGEDLATQRWSVRVQGRSIASRKTYGEGQQGEILCLVGSHQWVEIAVHGGSAQAQLGVTVGAQVLCQIHDQV